MKERQKFIGKYYLVGEWSKNRANIHHIHCINIHIVALNLTYTVKCNN